MHSVARSVAKKLALGRVAMATSLPQCAAAARLALPATRAELAEVCKPHLNPNMKPSGSAALSTTTVTTTVATTI